VSNVQIKRKDSDMGITNLENWELECWIADLDKELAINDAEEQETRDAGYIAQLRAESRQIDAQRAVVLDELARRKGA
jgi:hypothetical protein